MSAAPNSYAGIFASLPGGATNYSPAYGGVPNVPNPVNSAIGAAYSNIITQPELSRLAGGIDTANQSQLLNNYNMAIPNYSALTSSASGVTGQELQGQLPQDVINQLQQQAAERGISTGSPGSPNSNAAYLKALGLTSLGEQQTGMTNLSQLTASAPKAPLFDISNMFTTPDQYQSAGFAANTMAAAPVPSAAAGAATRAATGAAPGVNLGTTYGTYTPAFGAY